MIDLDVDSPRKVPQVLLKASEAFLLVEKNWMRLGRMDPEKYGRKLEPFSNRAVIEFKLS